MKSLFNYTRAFVLWSFFWIWLILIITAALLFAPIFKSQKISNKFVHFACKMMLKLTFIKVNVKQAQKELPFPVIFVSNHVSIFDIFISGSVLPGYPRGFELKKNFAYPIYGYFIKKFGQIPLDSTNKTHLKKSFNIAKALLDTKTRSFFVMPEGSRTLTGKVNEFKEGAFFLSQHTGVPIVPMTIKGLFELNNRVSYMLKPGKVEVILGKPIYPDDFNSTKEMSEHSRNAIIKALEH